MKMLKNVETSGKKYPKGTEPEGLDPETIKKWIDAGYISKDKPEKKAKTENPGE